MKKKFDKKNIYSLLFSCVLFGSIFYFTNNSLLLAASVSPEGKQAAVPVSGNSGVVLPQPPAPTETPQDIPKGESQQTSSSEKEAVITADEKNSPKNSYIVKPGQTLWEIAQETGLSLTTLMNENQLSNSFIIEGQELSYNP
ncbi:LysM peptidoglycan-binding domain-containing protein [Enterococcus rivorum]|uniref:LysM domain-containing protein n=1 Tax=Enterococcus rivorum TaxID=762845 RepID=A0A1E5L1E8_9ENTE|nr:LysM peptidoglycan-binding domain-containing protein [Enterococcus rivorum]MBP2098720.1 LysM repeat protein [Enterococcus rivorum]OEH83914.1 hypothetical protein BCR26_00110 [Enterococcus rivorum]